VHLLLLGETIGDVVEMVIEAIANGAQTHNDAESDDGGNEAVLDGRGPGLVGKERDDRFHDDTLPNALKNVVPGDRLRQCLLNAGKTNTRKIQLIGVYFALAPGIALRRAGPIEGYAPSGLKLDTQGPSSPGRIWVSTHCIFVFAWQQISSLSTKT